MQFLYFLEDIRIPVLNEFMLAITTLGDETAFLVIALILFWCVDKYIGYYTLFVGFFGVLANQFLKIYCRIPRPWIRDENFTILEQAKEAAGGYSFPSGHTQSAVGTFGSLAYTTKHKTLRIVCIILPVLVAFSRMYIGVHTPLDVAVSAVIALILIVVFRPLVLGNDHRNIPVLMGVMLVLAVGYLCFVELYQFPVDVDAENYQHAVENAYTLLGSLLGMLVVYILDEKWLHFDTKAVWWAQVLKTVLGIALVLAVMLGTKPILYRYLGVCIGKLVRYFLTVLTAGVLWPLTFRWFSKLGNRE